jgi:hypothetical protein
VLMGGRAFPVSRARHGKLANVFFYRPVAIVVAVCTSAAHVRAGVGMKCAQGVQPRESAVDVFPL